MTDKSVDEIDLFLQGHDAGCAHLDYRECNCTKSVRPMQSLEATVAQDAPKEADEDRCVVCNAPAIGICESCEAPICDKHEGGAYEDVYECADESACSARIGAKAPTQDAPFDASKVERPALHWLREENYCKAIEVDECIDKLLTRCRELEARDAEARELLSQGGNANFLGWSKRVAIWMGDTQ